MKISVQWLQELTGFDLTAKVMAEKFNRAGLEVDAITEHESETILDLSLTPNRGDCLSAMGLARELSALCDHYFEPRAMVSVEAEHASKREISLKDPVACPLYRGRVIEGVDLQKPTPDFILKRLQQNGTRSVNVVVDITNFVLLEMGQPMHAFDADRLTGEIKVRFAKAGETLTLINEQTVTLDAKTLVIADDAGPQAIAGVMGGLGSSTQQGQTKTLFLESAHFKPEYVAGTARRYGLQTDSAYRFERGVDPLLVADAMERASALIQKYAAGKAGPAIEIKESSEFKARKPIVLNLKKLKALSGLDLPLKQVTEKLKALGCEILETAADRLLIAVPSARFDLAIEVDLIEEVLRLIGFDNIPEYKIAGDAQLTHAKTDIKTLCSRHMVARGFSEIIGFGFIAPAEASTFTDRPLINLKNPISPELSVMRPTLLPSLLRTIAYNQHRQQLDLKIFTTGTCFLSHENQAVQEQNHFAVAITGMRYPLHFDPTQRIPVDFLDIKGELEALCAYLTDPKSLAFVAKALKGYHPGQCAEIQIAGESIGQIGQLHPDTAKLFDIKFPVFAFEIYLPQLSLQAPQPIKVLAKFPAVRRDIAMLVSSSVESSALIKAMQVSPLLQSVKVIDVYQGKGMPEGKRSIAFALHFQLNERTLTDEEVNQAEAAILAALAAQFGATLRE